VLATSLTKRYISQFFKKGVPQDYSGPRETDGIISWIEKKTGPVTVDLKSAAEVTAFLEKNKAQFVVLGYFNAAGSASNKLFVKAAEDPDMEEFKFGQAIGVSGHADGEVELHVQGGAPIKVSADVITLLLCLS
jgi:hypothetical protein